MALRMPASQAGGQACRPISAAHHPHEPFPKSAVPQWLVEALKASFGRGARDGLRPKADGAGTS